VTALVLAIVGAYRTSAYARWRRKRGLRCRFVPSCSEYCTRAVLKHGPWRGLLLAGWRLLRCNPWNSASCVDFP